MSTRKDGDKTSTKNQVKKNTCKRSNKSKLSNKEKAVFSEQSRVDMYPVDMNND